MHARERLSDQVLHRDEVLAVGFAEIEDTADVGVGDPRSDARLIEEHLDVVLLVGEMRMDPLERDELLETGCPSARARYTLAIPPEASSKHSS